MEAMNTCNGECVRWSSWALSVAILLNLSAVCRAQSTNDRVDFARQVLPILSNKCFICHGPDAKDADALRLDSREGAIADRGGYYAIDPRSPDDSELIVRIRSTDDPMPPDDAEKSLTNRERDILIRWVKEGGSYSKHWSFIAPTKPAMPELNNDTGNPEIGAIDQFVLARLQQDQLSFAPLADRSTLARRAALVLTGLPPEIEQLEQFLGDQSENAYERFVDTLLASPRFGEHQARYWLDAVRYGDTHGLHLDNRRGIYPYRDWVVRAINRNLPLDDFLIWQLAGDLLPDASIEQRVATGFVRMNPSTSEGGALPEEFQVKNNFDRTETLGTVLLGMSLNCARCHTHKYDPIPQTEYYRLMAFFNSTAEPAMDGNSYTYGPILKVPEDQPAWDRWTVLQERQRDLVRKADAELATIGVLSAKKRDQWERANDRQRIELLASGDRCFEMLGLVSEASELKKQLEDAEDHFTSTLVAKDLDEARATHVLHRGEYNQPTGDPVEPGILKIMGSFPAEAPRNRLGLANWLTSDDHPLVARVLVNQIWQRLFGAGLVRTPEDFGLQGEHPTHPQLLDWLAVELKESGWDLKHMVRLMATSRTFRQSSAWRADLDDPQNRLLGRGPFYRLDAEVLRDMALWASQLLDPHMGGEGVKPYQPKGMWLSMAHPASNTKQYERDTGKRLYRRSLYVYWKRTSPHPMMTLFDAPSRESSCVRRSRSNTSLQSLGLLNETQRVEMARTLAERLLREASDDAARLSLLFRLVACREPNDGEQTACQTLLATAKNRYEDEPDDAAALLSIGEASRDHQLEVASHAAWTQVCATVMASDVAILLY